MSTCPSCSRAIADGTCQCPACGAVVDDSSATTRLGIDPRAAAASAANVRVPAASDGVRVRHSADITAGERFLPGTILAGRYTVIERAGHGGMGEVYKVEDLKLGQTVALKCLPDAAVTDDAVLARLYREVSLARRVSHRNVCRVYDVGEMNGRPFLTMEFIRGEDLASVLKRFGRLPTDKAVEISRQLCAGLAAVHEQGLLRVDQNSTVY